MPAEEGHAEDIYEGQSQERSFDFFAELIAANAKRTYDEYQQVSLDHIRNTNNISERILSDAATASSQIIQQTIKHTADTDAQKVRHADVAIENQWESAEEVAMATVAGHIATHHTDPGDVSP